MADQAIALMAHLMRRAGFGAPYAELEARAAKGYDATVEELLHPESQPGLDEDIMLRYKTEWVNKNALEGQQEEWVFRMINTKRPLEEKMALFWHGIFCTGHAKCENPRQQSLEIQMFRQHGLGRYSDLLLRLAQDPAMVFYLDNCMSHKDAINENWGRELLELFSMGVGNYTETDVREASRAFTGWTIALTPPRGYYNRWDWQFEYIDEDHDDGEKTFLGHTGNFNGEDIIDIIVQQPACHRFIARHLYNFFVADEPQVPAWQTTPPRDPEAIETLAQAFAKSQYDIRSTLRVLFLSDFFKRARFAKIKSPAEVVVGLLRLAGGNEFPGPGIGNLAKLPTYMGQELLNPPSVEGWHTGAEWINSGTLMKRVNFAAEVLGDLSRPGIQSLMNRLKSQGDLSPEGFVDGCLDLIGPLQVEPEVRQRLVEHASEGGTLRWGTAQDASTSSKRVGEMLQLIASLREFQYC
ncbi:MAG: DUF1800 domain-containing protein [Candidatus Tectomicrobia bacterium]|nr:DUF1800 domain-containing protein [Candidatus Tectomicrobia bacterium]